MEGERGGGGWGAFDKGRVETRENADIGGLG